MSETLKTNSLTLEEISELTKENILDDTIFTRLFYFRDEVGEFQTLDLYHALCDKAKELGRLTLLREKYNAFKKRADSKQREKEQQERQEKRELRRAYLPSWVDEDNKINEVDFIDQFANLYAEPKYKCINGTMYDHSGQIDDEKVKQQIQTLISPHITRSLASTTNKILEALKTACHTEPPPLDPNKIHVQNGYYDLEFNNFNSDMTAFTLNRLNVWYDKENKEPITWLKYLNDLLHGDDIQTLQEYLGYCLIPAKKAQKALYIHGNGGEGKSRITVILNAIFGNSHLTINLKDLLNSDFGMATLENKLVVIDDDASSEALKETSRLKTLITNNDPMQVNPKGRPAYDTIIYARLIVLSNEPIQALYDNTEGLFRRQIILKTKDKPKDRVDDKSLTDKLLKEKDSIFMWCLEGLKRLISNGYNIHESEDSKKNLEELKNESFNVLDYVKNKEYIEFGDMTKDATSAELYYDSYCLWCIENAYEQIKKNTVLKHFKKYQNTYKITDSTNILRGDKKVRGFKGINLKKKYAKNT